jgi:hypothetical protein
MQTMMFGDVASLSKSLVRARRHLAAESPYGPAWAATAELVAELEADVRSLGIDPDLVAGTIHPAAPIRELVAQGRVA